MRIFLSDQQHHFPEHLERLRSMPVMPYERHQPKERSSSIDLGPASQTLPRAQELLFAYRIFPPHIMRSLTEWGHQGRAMRTGDTIVQQVHIPPWPRLSQKLVFGVRINAIMDGPDGVGFSYETLEGHVEKGVSSFTLHRNGDRAALTVHTLSGPGNILSALAGPVFSAPYQAYCTRKALEHVRDMALLPGGM